jgi:uncharacterized protein YkwD
MRVARGDALAGGFMPNVTSPRRGLRLARIAASLLTGTAVLLTVAPSGAMAQDGCLGARAAPSVQTLDRAAGAVVCLVNAERTRHGLRTLRGHGGLRQAAQRHSRSMVRRGFFSHVSPSGADLSDRLLRSGYVRGTPARHVGETLAWGMGTPSTPTGIVAGWIASPSHHRILLGRGFREVGVGVTVGTPQAKAGGATYTLDTGVSGG